MSAGSWLEAEELVARLLSGAGIAFDTNVLERPGEFQEVCSLINNVPGKEVPGTIDWFIAGHALARGWVLITNDKGPEFQGLPRARLGILKDALASWGSA